MDPLTYPAARPLDRVPRVPPRTSSFDITESAAPLTCANTDAQVIRFSGVPDAVDLAAHTFPVIFSFVNEMGVLLGEVTVGPGIPYHAQVRALVILARNAIAGSNGVASAIGKWARERPAHAPGESPAQWTAP